MIKSALGLECCLIYCAGGEYRIRVYNKDRLGEFKDYDIKHSDLWFEITDPDAFLYEDGDRMYLDHGPKTLGIDSST